MTSEKTSHKRPASQEVLAILASVYRDSSIQHDSFGRRAALPSEVARVLAQHTVEPFYAPSTTGESGTTSASDHLKASKG